MSKRKPRSSPSPSPIVIALIIAGVAALFLGAFYALNTLSISPAAKEMGVGQASAKTTEAEKTRSARQTRRATNATANNSSITETETPEGDESQSAPTATRDPRTPTRDFTPEPTGIVIEETITPYPSPTSLPPVATNHRDGYWAENVEFSAPETPFSDLDNLFDNVTFSPDGSQLAVSQWGGETIDDPNTGSSTMLTELKLINLSTSEETLLDQGIRPVWSPDGRHIAYLAAGSTARERFIKTIDLTNKTIKTITKLSEGEPATQYAWLNANNLVFFQERPLVFNVESETTAPLLSESVLSSLDSTAPLTFFMASAQTLVAASAEDILVLDTSQAEPQVVRHLNEGIDNEYWALSPGGQFLAYVPWSHKKVKIVNLTNDETIELPGANKGIPLVQSWSPDGSSVLYMNDDLVKIVNQDGSGLRQVLDINPSWPPIWSPSGDQIVWIGSDFRLYKSTIAAR